MAAVRRGDVFSAVGLHSADMYFEHCFASVMHDALKVIHGAGSLAAWEEGFRASSHLRSAEFNAVAVVAMASVYSPDPAGGGDGFGFWLPFDPASGVRRDEVLATWREFDPVHLVEREADALRRLAALYVECGSFDEYHLHVGARLLVERLRGIGLSPRYEEFPEGHRDAGARLDQSLPFVSAALARD
jgi:enterochelin esterase family protein